MADDDTQAIPAVEDHECTGSPVYFRITYFHAGLVHQEVHEYCCFEGIPSALAAYPAGAEPAEICVRTGGTETVIIGQTVRITTSLTAYVSGEL